MGNYKVKITCCLTSVKPELNYYEVYEKQYKTFIEKYTELYVYKQTILRTIILCTYTTTKVFLILFK